MQRERMARTGNNLDRARLEVRMRQHADVERSPIGVCVDLTGNCLSASREDPPQYGGNAVRPTVTTCRFVVHVRLSSKMPATRPLGQKINSALQLANESWHSQIF